MIGNIAEYYLSYVIGNIDFAVICIRALQFISIILPVYRVTIKIVSLIRSTCPIERLSRRYINSLLLITLL